MVVRLDGFARQLEPRLEGRRFILRALQHAARRFPMCCSAAAQDVVYALALPAVLGCGV